MISSKRGLILLAAAFAMAQGCASCAPDRVGPGVARLTVRNVGTMVSLLNADATCGFAAPSVLAAGVAEGSVGSKGSLTFTATSCVIDLGEGKDLSPNCRNEVSQAKGKVTLSATRKVTGTLTGNPATPIIPDSPDAVTITVTNATFENFEVISPTSPNKLNMISGSLSAVVKPRLAVAASSGACAISTPNATLSDIVYAESKVFVDTPDNKFEADVKTSSFGAQNGVNGGNENTLSGNITVFGSDVPVDGALDPDYDAAKFTEAYACTPDLAVPISYTCGDLRPRQADGAARLSAKMFGTITSLLDSNTQCGFSNTTVLQNGVTSGTVGETGSLTLTATNCTLNFATATTLPADCNNVSNIVEGSVTVTGTKVISGRFTGDPLAPIVPLTNQPATLSLTITVGSSGFKLSSTADANALKANAGTLTGTTKPTVYVGAATGACSVSSPHADLTVDWAGADLLLTSSSGTFALKGVSSDLAASNGQTTAGTNALSGTFTIDGTAFTVPADAQGLNPTFNLAAFDTGWQCGAAAAALASPISKDCGTAVVRTVAGGTAALTMRDLGAITSIVDKNQSCGFSSPGVALAPRIADGGVGDPGVTATFTLDGGCTISLPTDFVISTSCDGGTTTASGTFTVTGTKSVTGFLTGSSNPAEAIVPTSNKPAVFNLTAHFDGGFVVKAAGSTSFLTAISGSLSGTIQPRTALDPTTGACSLPTPNLTFSNVAWDGGVAALSSAGKLFNVRVGSSNLAAQNGSDGTNTNTLSGDITVDGIPLTGLSTALDPAFNQAAFDSSYVCAPANPVLVPNAACSFRQVLGGAAARLLQGSVLLATNASASCYANQTYSGSPGVPGTATAVASACMFTIPSGAIDVQDCTGARVTAEGGLTVDGTRVTDAGLLLNTDADAGSTEAILPLSRTAVVFEDPSYAMAGWRFEKFQPDGGSAGRITTTGTVALDKFIPILGEADAGTGTPSGQFSKRTPIFETTGMTANGTATLFLQGKTFKVNLSAMNVSALVGAVGGRDNDISGTVTVDGELVTLPAGSPFDPAYSKAQLDQSYLACDPSVLPVP